ncbi:MAG: hypothetical protein R2711_02390 [Acidimicrobiales bacterium]
MLHDVWVIARRGLVHMKRQPEQLSDATIQPIMFVLLFAFVFGGAIEVPGGGSYKEFLMGGIFAQTIVFSVRRGHEHRQRQEEPGGRPVPLVPIANGAARRPRGGEPAEGVLPDRADVAHRAPGGVAHQQRSADAPTATC